MKPQAKNIEIEAKQYSVALYPVKTCFKKNGAIKAEQLNIEVIKILISIPLLKY